MNFIAPVGAETTDWRRENESESMVRHVLKMANLRFRSHFDGPNKASKSQQKTGDDAKHTPSKMKS